MILMMNHMWPSEGDVWIYWEYKALGWLTLKGRVFRVSLLSRFSGSFHIPMQYIH